MKPKSNYVPGPMDNCMSPPYAVSPIIPLIDIHYAKADGPFFVWEPCSGTGNLSKRLQRAGFDVLGTDIESGEDFFEYTPPENEFEGDFVIVTNPPWGLKYKFLERCYKLGNPFALLMPVEVQGAERAQALFRERGVQVIYTSPRINFSMPDLGWIGAAQMPTAWFTWGLTDIEQQWFDFRPHEEYREWEEKVFKVRLEWIPLIENKKKYYKDKDIKVDTKTIIAELEAEYGDRLPDRFNIK